MLSYMADDKQDVSGVEPAEQASGPVTQPHAADNGTGSGITDSSITGNPEGAESHKVAKNKQRSMLSIVLVIFVLLVVVAVVWGIADRHHSTSNASTISYSTKKLKAGSQVFYISFTSNALGTDTSSANTQLLGKDLNGNVIVVEIYGPNPSSQIETQSSCSPLSDLEKVNILGSSTLVCGGVSAYKTNVYSEVQSDFKYNGKWYGLNLRSTNPAKSVDLKTFKVIASSLHT